MRYYTFVTWEAIPKENFLKTSIPAAIAAYDAGDKQPLKDLHICTQNPVYRFGGWEMPYRSYLRRFWVKTKYYGIQQYFALNKTDIRKELKSDALEIVEVSTTGHAAYVG